MKKTVFMLSMSSLLILNTACNKQKSNEQNTDTVAVEDKLPEAKETETKEAQYLSVDLQTYNLHGQVKDVEIFHDQMEVPNDYYSFDRQGRIIKTVAQSFEGTISANYKYEDESSFKGEFENKEQLEENGQDASIKRDDKNRILSLPTREYTYDEQGRVKTYNERGWESMDEFVVVKFNDNNDELETTYTGGGEGMEWSGTTTYEYTQYDDHGNWTECTTTTQQKMDDENETIKQHVVRKITYHE